jgi:hypothetical protein
LNVHLIRLPALLLVFFHQWCQLRLCHPMVVPLVLVLSLMAAAKQAEVAKVVL